MQLHRSLGSDDKLFYFNENAKECDFIVLRSGKVAELVQICCELTPENKDREINGLVAAAKVTGCRKCQIITFEQEETIRYDGFDISVVSAWRM